MSATVLGRTGWNLKRDKEGHREYDIKWLVWTSAPAVGPYEVMYARGMPAIGTGWQYGGWQGRDLWAKCWPNMDVNQLQVKDEPNQWWTVKQKFSTKPLVQCQDEKVGNPLDEPIEVGGTFRKYTEEGKKDWEGKAIKSSSHEEFHGKTVEFDANRPTVEIGMNVLLNPLETFAPMVDHVNDAELWGLPTRCVKLSNVTWKRRLYGLCYYYYSVKYEFDCRYDTFDRDVPDVGSMVLAPGGNAAKPLDFIRYKDMNGENNRVYLDGVGNAITDEGNIHFINIKFYKESNLLILGIPSSL